ncbi:MAG TPA: hypothetical protein EYN91_25690 [Candidatus Melainabacteria bacterium]|nr:hypothetical protein [Candidatus Melainabacteria bacterium]
MRYFLSLAIATLLLYFPFPTVAVNRANGMLGDGLINIAKEIAVCRIGTSSENVEICSSDKKFKIVQQWLREHLNCQLLNTRILESTTAKYRLFLLTTCLKYTSPAKQGASTLMIIPFGHEVLGDDYEALCDELRNLIADEKPRKKSHRQASETHP